MHTTSLTREQELDLHRQLVEGDPVAPQKLASIYLTPLLSALQGSNARVPYEFVEEAVHLAIANVCKKPARFDPGRTNAKLPLFAYLQMSAQGDLRNRLRGENRHWRGRKSLDGVAQSADGGKYLGRDDDPSLPLEIREAAERADQQILSPVRDGLSDEERSCLELMMQEERKTSAFARVLQITHLSENEQRVVVKRVKDKLKKRIKRRDHG